MNRYFAFILVMLLIPIDSYASYFNTDRPQKIIGSFLNKVEHLDEISAFSNAFGFVPRTANEITQYFDANVHKIYAGRSDDPLNETGRSQAREAARQLDGVEIGALYTSPLRRTLETAPAPMAK